MKTIAQSTPLTSTEPTKLKFRLYQIFFKLFGCVGRLYLSRFFHRVEVVGKEHLKTPGSKFVLMNHSCPLDPLLITFFGGVPEQFLITEAYMQGGLGTKIASIFGQISKRKLDFDTISIRLLKAWSDQGANIATFPEGQFSWDGSPNPVLPGIDQLVKYLNVPIITVRLINGDRVKPTWANHFRKTSIKIVIDPPKSFAPKEDIHQYIQDKLYIDQQNCERWPVEGENLSAGLKKLIRFCPHCGDENLLQEISNDLKCGKCENSWTVTPENLLKGKSDLTITDLLKITYQQIDKVWEEKKEYISVGQVELIDLTKKHWVKLDRGKLKINQQTIDLGQWELKHSEIKDHTLDWGDLIILRTRYQRLALKMPQDSRAIWTYLINKVMGR